MRQEGREWEGQNSGEQDIRRSVEGRGMGRGTWGIEDGHYRDFQEGKQGCKAPSFEVKWRRSMRFIIFIVV